MSASVIVSSRSSEAAGRRARHVGADSLGESYVSERAAAVGLDYGSFALEQPTEEEVARREALARRVIR